MNQALPEDVIKARNLLNEFEKSCADLKLRRIWYFDNAIDALNSHLRDYPDSPCKEIIFNIKLSYTRSLLRQLSEFRAPDVRDWIKIALLFIRVKNELSQITETIPELKKSYQNFMLLYPKWTLLHKKLEMAERVLYF